MIQRSESGSCVEGEAGVNRHLHSVPTDHDRTAHERVDQRPKQRAIDQAVDVIRARFELDPARAYDLLDRWSSHLGLTPYALALVLTVRAGPHHRPLEPPDHVLRMAERAAQT